VIEQNLEIYRKELEKLDGLRTRNMAASGLVVGAFCHYWYKVLDKRVPGRSFKIVTKKVLIDQLIASPIVISLFFVTLGIMRRESVNETMDEIRNKFIRLYKAEWIVWPTAQIINFWILPSRFRVLYDNTISLGYDVYTSMVINEPIPHSSNENLSITIKDNTDNLIKANQQRS
jgi:protein Mpv17